MKTLYIHLGTPKTGTTAIQEFLDQNSDVLYKKGYIFRYMPFHKYATKTRRIPKRRNGYFLHGDKQTQLSDPDANKKLLDEGLRTIDNWFREKDQVILTDEGIFHRLTKWEFMPQIKSFADAHNFSVKLVLYLRRQDEYVESHYRQILEDGKKNTVSWQEFLEERTHIADYETPIFYLSDLFGKEQIILRRYDPAAWKAEGTNIFEDFLKTIGIDPTEEFSYPKKLSNTSISYNVGEIKRILNRVKRDKDNPDTAKINKMFADACYACSANSEDHTKYTYFSPEERDSYLSSFQNSDQHIANTFFQGEQLFGEKKISSVTWSKDNPAMLSDTILFYGAVAAQLEEMIQEQEKQLKRIEKFSPICWFRRLKQWFRKKKNK